jgi:hypothetical protein
MRSLRGGTGWAGLFPPKPAPKDIYERKEQAEGEGQEDEEHNGEMQREYSP